MAKDSNNEMIRRIENFIQNLDDGLLILHPSGMEIKYDNEEKTELKSLNDWILNTIDLYEDHRKTRNNFKSAKLCSDWIRRGYANNVIRVGTNLLQSYEELKKEYKSVQDECETLRGMNLVLEGKYEKYKKRKDREVRRKNR